MIKADVQFMLFSIAEACASLHRFTWFIVFHVRMTVADACR